ncbi:MAG TPA: transketolase C-terminal domain-containing protein [candidate division Zixibacteria bacterium]|nr:transketolase C-terminal domain-containing protein [candidate division Zixibacteria bacterium]
MQLGERAGLKSSKPMRDVFGDALLAVATENPKVVVLDGDLGNSTKAEKVRERFPERFFNIGIAESNLVGIGAGMAGAGFIPWITSFSSFLLCNAYDQIRLSIAMSNLNAKILGSHGGITLGKDGATQMGIEDLALMGGLPTMTILVPCDPASMYAAVRAATDHDGPVFLRSSRVPMPHIYPEENCPFEIGKANIVRQGKDLTIIACGLMVPTALDAAVVLAEEGIEARVMDLHTIRPMDEKAIVKAAQETGAILVAEEHLLHGGVGSNVARIVAENHPVPMRFVGLEDTYVDSADPADLLRKYHLTAGDLVNQARDLILAKQARDG